jgi:hypothetical protein
VGCWLVFEEIGNFYGLVFEVLSGFWRLELEKEGDGFIFFVFFYKWCN